jgi:hypothetical protein
MADVLAAEYVLGQLLLPSREPELVFGSKPGCGRQLSKSLFLQNQPNAHVEVSPVLANRAVAVYNDRRVDVWVFELIADLFAMAAAGVGLDFCVFGPRNWQGVRCSWRGHGLWDTDSKRRVVHSIYSCGRVVTRGVDNGF